jgi:DNA polymerase III delta prime subunit
MLAEGPDDWVAVHSLDLAPWNRWRRTEIDFVVIMPDTGILCIEVKSHDYISFHDDRWHPDTIKRSPFRQALDGSSALHRRLRGVSEILGRIPVVHCCVFPRARFDLQPNLAIRLWELIDGNRFREFVGGREFCGQLKENCRRSIEGNPGIPPLQAPMAPGWIGDLINQFTPAQKHRPDKREEIGKRQEQLEKLLRIQQKPVLQLAELNPRILVQGPAGTGKTLIAMELARRAAASGKRVALFCFNRLIGKWLMDEMERNEPSFPGLVAGWVHGVLPKLANIDIPENPDNIFWEEELPGKLEDRLTDPDFSAQARFDLMILDEGQDILARPMLAEMLFHFLEGGKENGNWIVFGDFIHQMLAATRNVDLELAGLCDVGRPCEWQLGENCRNYPVVGDAASTISFGKTIYTGYLRTGGSHNSWDIYFYQDLENQAREIGKMIDAFRHKGYHDGEITILTAITEKSSVVPRLRDLGIPLHPAGRSGIGVEYSTVHAFKGMESKVVILTDLVPGNSDRERHILYTGITRATEEVRVFCARDQQDILLGWMEGNGES